MAITNSYGTRIIKILDSVQFASGSEGSNTTPIPNPANFIKNYGSVTGSGGTPAGTEISVAGATFQTDLEKGVFEIGDTYYNSRYFSYSSIIEVVNQTTLKLSDRNGFTGGTALIFKRNTRPCNLYVTCKAAGSGASASAVFNIATELLDNVSLTANTTLTGGSVSELIPLQVMYLKRTATFTGEIHAIFN